MRWPWQRHRCPTPWPVSDDLVTVGRSFTCPECGQRWREVWVSDVVEYTLMSYADIGEWVWRKVDPAR